MIGKEEIEAGAEHIRQTLKVACNRITPNRGAVISVGVDAEGVGQCFAGSGGRFKNHELPKLAATLIALCSQSVQTIEDIYSDGDPLRKLQFLAQVMLLKDKIKAEMDAEAEQIRHVVDASGE